MNHAAHDLKRRDFLKQATVSAAALATAGCGTRRPPNILFLLTDNHRWDAMSCAGNAFVRTPHMDGLAADGVLFEHMFATSATSMASRASILTGMYERAHGCNLNTGDLSPEHWAQSYPVLLRKAGYRTGFAGMFGLAVTDTPHNADNTAGTTWLDPANLPADSFDYWGGFAGPGNYFPESNGGQHLTGMLAARAENFIADAPVDRPWCLSVSFKAPGEPFTPDPVYRERYEDAEIPMPLTFGGYFYGILPDFIKTSHACTGIDRAGVFASRHSSLEHHRDTMKQYYRLLTGIDDTIGSIRAALAANGMADNTVIILAGATGDLQGEHYLAGNTLLYEESVRVPLIIHDPRRRAKAIRPAGLAANIDIAPTILDLAGIAAPAGMHGRSLVPLLGDDTVGWREDILLENRYLLKAAGELIQDYPRCEAVRTERWKYIRYPDRDPVVEQLFDIDRDPGETQDHVRNMDHRGTLLFLRRRLDTLLAEARSTPPI